MVARAREGRATPRGGGGYEVVEGTLKRFYSLIQIWCSISNYNCIAQSKSSVNDNNKIY